MLLFGQLLSHTNEYLTEMTTEKHPVTPCMVPWNYTHTQHVNFETFPMCVPLTATVAQQQWTNVCI